MNLEVKRDGPSCAFCGKVNVRRTRSLKHRHQLVDGKAYRIYCSTSCGANVNGPKAHTPKNLVHMWERGRARAKRIIAERLKADVKELAKAWRIPEVEVAKFGWACERRGYYRGYRAAWESRRRKLLA